MRQKLSLTVWIKPQGVVLTQIETLVLHQWQPPLNLTKVARPCARLRTARKQMADQARTWAANNAPDM